MPLQMKRTLTPQPSIQSGAWRSTGCQLMRPPPCFVWPARTQPEVQPGLAGTAVSLCRRGSAAPWPLQCGPSHPFVRLRRAGFGWQQPCPMCCCQRRLIANKRSLDPSESSQRAVQGHGNWACLVVCTSGAQKCSRGRRFQLCVLEFASRLDHLLQLLDLRLALGCRLLRRSCRLNLQSVCRAPPQESASRHVPGIATLSKKLGPAFPKRTRPIRRCGGSHSGVCSPR